MDGELSSSSVRGSTGWWGQGLLRFVAVLAISFVSFRAPDPQCPLEYIDYHHLHQYYVYLYRPASPLAVLL